jgi:hypothetical protein
MPSPKTIRNTPKKIQQITAENTTPYLPERGAPEYPNTNRGHDVSMRGEVFNDLTVGIEDINDAVLYYFNQVIRPYVIEDGSKVNVPVYYANPERWKASQSDGMYRDTEGKIIFPVIVVNRTNIEKVRTIGNKLDGNEIHNYAVYEKRYSAKNHYDNFCVLTNRIPVKEYLNVAIPDYYRMTYACSIYTSFVQDLDRIIEAIGQYSYSYWGKEGKFKFMAMIDSFNSRTEITQGNDRVIVSNFDLTLNGYITPKDINKHMATRSKFLSKSQIIFTAEVQDTEQQLEQAMKCKRKQASFNIFPEKVTITGGGTGNIDMNLITYLNTNKGRIASTVTAPNVATFINTKILQPPSNSGLPLTTSQDFRFFINGQYVPSFYVTLTENAQTVTAVFNTAAIGYTLEADDEVVGIGKFYTLSNRGFSDGFDLGFN